VPLGTESGDLNRPSSVIRYTPSPTHVIFLASLARFTPCICTTANDDAVVAVLHASPNDCTNPRPNTPDNLPLVRDSGGDHFPMLRSFPISKFNNGFLSRISVVANLEADKLINGM
jgi:hypothetical protein